MIFPECPVCGIVETSQVFDHLMPHPYKQCTNCNILYQPNMGGKVYEADHEHLGSLMSDQDKQANKTLADLLWRNHLSKKVDASQYYHFDIGSKYPYLAHCMQKHDVKSMGIDGIEEGRGFGDELEVPMIVGDFEGDISTWDFPKDTIDRFSNNIHLITLVHCLEHFYKPKETLRKIRKIMTDDGVLFIRCPDSDAAGIERDFTEGHYSIHPVIWNERAMYELLAQLQDCFYVEETYTLHGQRDYILRPLTCKPTIGAGLIVKNEETDLPKCLKSIEGIVDQVCIRDTGSTDDTEKVATAHKVGDYKYYYGASDQSEDGDWQLWSFGKARNEYVKALDNEVDWLLWMDADDTVSDAARTAIRRAPYMPYDIHAFAINGGHYHHRLWRTKSKVVYAGDCHEYPSWPSTFRIKMWDSGTQIRHQYELGYSGIFRNMRILEREVETTPSHRVIFYLANTFRDAAGIPTNTQEEKEQYLGKAIERYDEYLSTRSAYFVEAMFCLLYKARCHRLLGQYDQCIQTVRSAIAKDNSYAELYMEACYSEHIRGEHWQAISWALQASKIPYTHRLFSEKNKYTDQPLRQLTHCFSALGCKDIALFWGAKVRDHVKDPSWEKFLTSLQDEPKVVNILRAGAIGDILVTGWALEGLREKHPEHKIIYYTKIPEMANLLDVDEVRDSGLWSQRSRGFDYPLVGYPIKEGYPNTPMKKHLIDYICEECGVTPKRPKFDIGGDINETPYITIHVKTGWSVYKEWPVEKWTELVKLLKATYNLPIFQLGGESDPLIEGISEDFRGKTDLRGTLHLIKQAKLHIGGDSFTNHAAGLFETKAVILFGSTSPVGSGYPSALNIWEQLPCSPCYKEDPKLSCQPMGVCNNPEGQTYANPKHECMHKITVDQVYINIQLLLVGD